MYICVLYYKNMSISINPRKFNVPVRKQEISGRIQEQSTQHDSIGIEWPRKKKAQNPRIIVRNVAYNLLSMLFITASKALSFYQYELKQLMILLNFISITFLQSYYKKCI